MIAPLVGTSKAIKKIIKQIHWLSGIGDNILIIGERGAGKGVIANHIHAASFNSNSPLPQIVIEPAGIAEKELLVQLYGNDEEPAPHHCALGGILTVLAEGGTVLVKEIERSGFRNQKVLLKFLEQLKHTNGESAANRIRVIVTMKHDPQKLVHKRSLTVGLADHLASYHRLFVPPLRERKEDIPQLVEHFVGEACRNIGIEEPIIDIQAIEILVNRQWENNIYELKAVIDRSIHFSKGATFMLPQEMVAGTEKAAGTLEKIFEAFERIKSRSSVLTRTNSP